MYVSLGGAAFGDPGALPLDLPGAGGPQAPGNGEVREGWGQWHQLKITD